ncbi:methyltransferase domain-containing protein [Salmonella enterica]|nr:methyltransferase domain-containing protein [Salmonella enterica]
MKLGNEIALESGKQWAFDNNVVPYFDSHVQQSVPVYLEGHELICFISDFFVRDNAIIYEVGSSTGALINKIFDRHHMKNNVRFIGIEPVKSMVEQAKKQSKGKHIEYINECIEVVELEPCNLIVSYYCVQFIEMGNREYIFHKFYEKLQPGGALIIFEKEIINDSKINEIVESCYLKFKLKQGFSIDEVLSKKFSLEGVMNTNTENQNIRLLMNAGFTQFETIMKYGEFHGYLCIK